MELPALAHGLTSFLPRQRVAAECGSYATRSGHPALLPKDASRSKAIHTQTTEDDARHSDESKPGAHSCVRNDRSSDDDNGDQPTRSQESSGKMDTEHHTEILRVLVYRSRRHNGNGVNNAEVCNGLELATDVQLLSFMAPKIQRSRRSDEDHQLGANPDDIEKHW